MENEKTATKFLMLTERIPVREIAIDKQNPEVELTVLLDIEITDDELNGDALNNLKKLGLYDEHKKRQGNLPITEFQGPFKLKRNQQINSIQHPIPLDEFPDLTDNLISLDLEEEKQKDADIRTVKSWMHQTINNRT